MYHRGVGSVESFELGFDGKKITLTDESLNPFFFIILILFSNTINCSQGRVVNHPR